MCPQIYSLDHNLKIIVVFRKDPRNNLLDHCSQNLVKGPSRPEVATFHPTGSFYLYFHTIFSLVFSTIWQKLHVLPSPLPCQERLPWLWTPHGLILLSSLLADAGLLHNAWWWTHALDMWTLEGVWRGRCFCFGRLHRSWDFLQRIKNPVGALMCLTVAYWLVYFFQPCLQTLKLRSIWQYDAFSKQDLRFWRSIFFYSLYLFSQF